MSSGMKVEKETWWCEEVQEYLQRKRSAKENWISTGWEGREIDGNDMQQVSVIKERDRNGLTYTRGVIKGKETYVEEQMNEEN